MAIYDAEGNALSAVYDASGAELEFAYDAEGNVIFQREEPTGIPLRVMSYNVGQWYYGGGSYVPADKDAEYYALQTGMLQRADADVAFFQEFMTTFSGLPRTADSVLSPFFPYRNCRNSGTYFGRGICSKYEITNYTTHSYTNETQRYYDSATINVDDIPITVVVTHLATDSKRYDQVTELIEYLSTLDRFICCGDFNAVYFNGTNVEGGTTEETQDYTGIVVPLLNAGFKLANWSSHGYKYTYSDEPTSTWTGCLDNVVTSPNIIINSVHVDTAKLSDTLTERCDHMPIIADLLVVTESE